jgi:catechol 2,3-dioxygenase-like lactoylglutathione lyase family enzyme
MDELREGGLSMKMPVIATALAISMSIAPPALRAQLLAQGAVTNGHYHFNVSDMDAHEEFWGEVLGAKADTFGAGTPMYKFDDALVLLREQAPEGPMVGGSVDHIGFTVPDLREKVDRFIAAGYELVTHMHAPPGVEVDRGIAMIKDGMVSGFAHVIGPEGIKVELLEMRTQAAPIVSHHVHFFVDEPEMLRDWYVDMFGAQPQPGPLPGIVSAVLPGLLLNFNPKADPVTGTAGRVLDHIGFEIDDLESLVTELAGKGVEFDVELREIPQIGLKLAFLTDPWGTSIELTQGLDDIR